MDRAYLIGCAFITTRHGDKPRSHTSIRHRGVLFPEDSLAPLKNPLDALRCDAAVFESHVLGEIGPYRNLSVVGLANRNNAAYHKLCSRWTRILGDRETRLARRRNRPGEQRTSECQSAARCVVSRERLSLAVDFAISVGAPDKGILGSLYLLSSRIWAWMRKRVVHSIRPG